MAPRNKRPCQRASFDRSRFLSEADQNFFMNKFQLRSIVPERIILYNELHETDFGVWMCQRRWFTLYDLGYQIVVNWVREFYSNMHEVSTSSFKTFVQGQELEITPNLLSKVLQIHRVEGADFPVVDNREINYNLVAKKLTGKHVAWIGRDISHLKLSESYRLLNIFIRHNVKPKVNKKVTKDDGYLLYCIGTQRKVNLPLAVFRGMAKVQTASHNATLPFPRVISKHLVDMGKLAEPNEDIIIPKQKIDLFTLEKSKSHLPSIELDDDDEGDIVGPSRVVPSAVGPSLAGPSDVGLSGDDRLGEGEVHALNEHLRHLEVQVNEGFAEMRQSFAEMLDRLRRD